jgi:hypothetical protein
MALPATAVVSAPTLIDEQTKKINDATADQTYGFKNGSFMVVPIPFSNPTIGSGLMLGAGYLFNLDDGSKPSLIGLGALRSDNGSEAFGLVGNFALLDNRWLITSFVGTADLQYDLYTSLATVPINQDGTLARATLSYGVTPDLSFGGSLRYLKSSIGLSSPLLNEFARDLNLELIKVGAIMGWDRRDDAIYPTSGSNLFLEASYGASITGTSRSYQSAYATYDLYRSFGADTVLATRFATCAASEDTPFFDQCSLGTTDGFRGFSATQFLDTRLASVQLELRHRLTDRIGVAAFAGAGAVGPTFSDLDTNGVQSAGGIGFRYRVSRKYPVDFAVDGTINSLSERLLYIYVGQRF